MSVTSGEFLAWASRKFCVHVMARLDGFTVSLVALSNSGPTLAYGEGRSLDEAVRAASADARDLLARGWDVVDGQVRRRMVAL